jgi:hypothetical protein
MQIEGISLPDTIQLEGKTLQLNGAGIRTRFFFDIYVGGFYLQQPTASAKAAIIDPGPKRVTMNILFSELERDKLIHGWQRGFEKNQPAERMKLLQPRLDRFNALFTDARRGDSITFDLFRDGTTHVRFNGKEWGVINGVDFQQALLAVWLGIKPADGGLKQAMLGRR